MAQKTKVETNILSVEAEKDFQQHVNEIKKLDMQRSGIASALAYHLTYIEDKKYFTAELDGSGNHYKSIGKYAEDKWGIKKATVSEAINTFRRFGDMETGEIKPEYKLYNFTALIKIRSYSDDDIRACKLIPEAMSVARIVDKLDTFKSEKAERQTIIDTWNRVVPAMSDRKKKDMYKELIKEFNTAEPVIADLDMPKARLVRIILDKYSVEKVPVEAEKDEAAKSKEPNKDEAAKSKEPNKDEDAKSKPNPLIQAFVLEKADFAKVADLLARITGTDTAGAAQFVIKAQ